MKKILLATFELNSEREELSEFLSREDIEVSKVVPQVKEAIIDDTLEIESNVIVEYSHGYNRLSGKIRGIVYFNLSTIRGAQRYNDFISIDDLEVVSLKSCSGKKSGNDYYFVEYISGRDLSEFLNQDSEEDSLF